MRVTSATYYMTGACTGGLCVGWNAQNVLWNVIHDMDNDNGTPYQGRLKIGILGAQDKGLVVSNVPDIVRTDESKNGGIFSIGCEKESPPFHALSIFIPLHAGSAY